MKYKILIFALAIIISSCGKAPHSHDHDGHDDHHHEHTESSKIFITAYNSKFEVFAEADVFVTGKKANVLSHFTHLNNFQPLENGKVTARLIINGKETSQTLDKPARKGIYSFDLTPSITGTGRLLYILETEKGKSVIKAENIEVFKEMSVAEKAAHNAEPSMTNSVVFTKEQSWKVDFETQIPSYKPFGQIIKTSAQVESAAGDEVIVSSKTNGILMFSSENVIAGAKSTKGSSVFSVSGNGLAQDNSAVRFNEAKTDFLAKKEEYERVKELEKDKIISEKELLVAKTDFENAKFLYNNLKKHFNAQGETAKSPMTGFVKQIFAQNGQYVEAGQAILSITKNKTLFLRADVQQKYGNVLDLISDANIVTFQNSNSYNLKELNGKVLSVGKTTNTNNYLIPVSLQIENNGNFFAGEFVEVYLKTISNKNTITVPNSALIEDQGSFFVFAQIHPELFEKKEVKLGGTDGRQTEIIKGLAKNERVVTKGTILVKLAQASGALDPHAGHVH